MGFFDKFTAGTQAFTNALVPSDSLKTESQVTINAQQLVMLVLAVVIIITVWGVVYFLVKTKIRQA